MADPTSVMAMKGNNNPSTSLDLAALDQQLDEVLDVDVALDADRRELKARQEAPFFLPRLEDLRVDVGGLVTEQRHVEPHQFLLDGRRQLLDIFDSPFLDQDVIYGYFVTW